MMTEFTRGLLPFLVALGVSSLPSGAGEPVVVELFTSQGCSSCPPADAYLAELADREDVIALSMHVDYWDYLGWKDSFAREECVIRQYAYRDALDTRVVYTPQMVVQGAAHAVGSARETVEDLIRTARAETRPDVIEIAPEDGMLMGRLAPGPDRAGTLWVAVYHGARRVEIARGENAGRSVTYRNVVESLTRLGDWTGARARAIELPRPGQGQGVALWVQRDPAGPILAAARYEE